MFNLSGFLK